MVWVGLAGPCPLTFPAKAPPPTCRVRSLVSCQAAAVTETAFLLMKQKAWPSVLSKLPLTIPFFSWKQWCWPREVRTASCSIVKG